MTVPPMHHILHGTPQALQDGKSVQPRLLGLGVVVALAALDQLAGAVTRPLGGDVGKFGTRRDDCDVGEEVPVWGGGARGVDVKEARHFGGLFWVKWFSRLTFRWC